jgi:hypothetical protein
MLADALDQTLLFQHSQSTTSNGAIDTETIDDDGGGDELGSGDFLMQLIQGLLVEGDGIVGLVLDLSFGPFLIGVKIVYGNS